MPMREIIVPGLAYPPDFGSPTSLAIQAGGFVFVSGMVAWDAGRNIVGGNDPYAQTVQALRNMQATLREAGTTFADVVKITFYLTEIAHKSQVWDARKELFAGARPASTLVQVVKLVDPAALVEIDAIAHVRAAAGAKA